MWFPCCFFLYKPKRGTTNTMLRVSKSVSNFRGGASRSKLPPHPPCAAKALVWTLAEDGRVFSPEGGYQNIKSQKTVRPDMNLADVPTKVFAKKLETYQSTSAKKQPAPSTAPAREPSSEMILQQRRQLPKKIRAA